MYLVKLIDWTIDVPEESDLIDKYQRSVKFPIEFNGEKSHWMLECNFKAKYNHVGFYITYASHQPFDRDFQYRIYLRNQDESSVIHSHPEPGRVSIHSEKLAFFAGDGYGEPSFLKHDDIIKHKSRFCPDGKLHLKIEIYFFDNTEKDLSQSSVKATSTSYDDPLHPFNLMVSETPDVKLKMSDGSELSAHKSILIKKSTVFRTMFDRDLLKSFPGVLYYKGPVVKELLRFIYFSEFRSLKELNIDLYQAAQHFQIEELPELCLQSIRDNLNHENVVDTLIFADKEEATAKDLFLVCCELLHFYFHDSKVQEKWKECPTISSLKLKILETLQMTRKMRKHITLDNFDFDI